MSLPVINAPTYTIDLLSRNGPVRYRPYTVKEEKLLLMAVESKEENQIFEAVVQSCQLCVLDDIDVSRLPIFELEKLILAIRSKSVGEDVEFRIPCPSCETETKVKIDLTNVKENLHEDIIDKLMLNDDYGIKFKIPTSNDIINVNREKNSEDSIDYLIACIESVYDKENVFNFDDYSHKEKVDFMNSITLDHIKTIKEKFMDKLPKNTITVNYKCPKCKKKIEETVENLIDFFI